MKNLPIIERESEIIALIDSYIAKGRAVKKPLLIKLNQGWGRDQIRQYLKTKYDKSILDVSGHPLRQGKASDYPELVNTFLPPAGFDPTNPPLFFFFSLPAGLIWNPLYVCECVSRYSIPFVYLAPTGWLGDNSKPTAEPDLSGFESVEYYPTIKGWLTDMKSDEELPLKKRLLSSNLKEFVRYDRWDDDLITMIGGQLKLQRFELLLNFAESIKNHSCPLKIS